MRFASAKHKTEELWCYPYFKSYPIRLLVGFSNISWQVHRAGFLAGGCGPTRIRTKRAPEARVSSLQWVTGACSPGKFKKLGCLRLHIYMLFTGREVRIGGNCTRGLEYSKPGAPFLPTRTDRGR